MPRSIPVIYRTVLAALVSFGAIQGATAAPMSTPEAAPAAAPDAQVFAGLVPAVRFSSQDPLLPESADDTFFANNDIRDLRERYDALLPTFFTGLDLRQEHSRLFLMIDLREDFRNWLTTSNTINLPFLGEGIGPLADSNFPGVGYLSWDGGNGMSASLGRRKIAWGRTA